MKKKMIGFIFAATMLFGASMTAFAATDASGNDVTQVSGNDVIGDGDVKMDAEVTKPHLEVTITAGTKIIANPYGLAGGDLTADETLKGSTIKFENKSNTAISVALTGQVVLPKYETSVVTADKVTVATSATSLNTAKTKQVFVQAEITNGGSGKLQTTAGTAAEKALVYSATGAKLSNVPVLAAQGDTSVVETSDTILLTITGGTSKSPTSEWTDADAFSVVTKYDIQFGDRTKLSKFK